jgi:hypothetical protein
MKKDKKRVYYKLNYHNFLHAVGLIRIGQAGRFRTYKPKQTRSYSEITDPMYFVLAFEYETEDAVKTIFEPIHIGQIMDWFIKLDFDFYLIHFEYLSYMILDNRELVKFSQDYYLAQKEKAELLTKISEEDSCQEQPTLFL